MSNRSDLTVLPLNEKFPTPKQVYIMAAVMALAGTLVYPWLQWSNFSIKPNLANSWQDIFTKYIFIIVGIERAAAVWVGIQRNESTEKWKARVTRMNELFTSSEVKPAPINSFSQPELKSSFKQEKSIVERDHMDPSQTLTEPHDKQSEEAYKKTALGYLRQLRVKYIYRYEQFKRETNDKIAKAVFLGGLGFAILGLSFLGDIIDISSLDPALNGYEYQKALYHLGDILITGGLLGGGSVGLTKLFDTLNSFMGNK